MTPKASVTTGSYPAWLSLLQKPYDQMLGGKSDWSLRGPNGVIIHIERGSQGLNNNIFRVRVSGDTFACKLFVADERQRAYREWAALKAVHAAGLALAPEPLAYALDGPLPQPTVVYRWVEGAPFAAGVPGDDELISLIAALNRIHRTPPAEGLTFLPAWHQPASYTAYLDEIRAFIGQVRTWVADSAAQAENLPTYVADLPALLPLFEETVRLAEATVAGESDPGAYPIPALVRVDGNLDNVLRDPTGRLVFVDWEYSGSGDPAYDLAELRWHPRARGVRQDQWEAALAGYEPHPVDRTFGRRLAIYSRLLPAWWVGRSALHLLEGAGQIAGHKRLVKIPERLYRAVRSQLDGYLAALGLFKSVEAEEAQEE
jgi:aminoglycoside phosphotransferase (APT) family kinase protein